MASPQSESFKKKSRGGLVSISDEENLLDMDDVDADDVVFLDEDNDDATPSLLMVHLALIAAQCLFGSGAVVARLGLPSVNPVLFALLREGTAGPILCALAWLKDRRVPRFEDYRLFLVPGFCLFLTQLFFIAGIKMSSSVTAAAWQPSMPIFAVVMGLFLGTEKNVDKWKVCGLVVGFGGALFMVLFHSSFSGSVKDEFGGNICFFINCSALTYYFIACRPVCEVYPPATVTGYSYLVASLCIAMTALVVGFVDPLLNFICSDCDGHAWHVPLGCLWAAAYWSILLSVVCYRLLTWANQYTDPSMTLGYTVLQPMVAAVLSEVLIAVGLADECHGANDEKCLYGPSLKHLGAIGIVLGLYCVIRSDRKYKAKLEADGVYATVRNTSISENGSVDLYKNTAAVTRSLVRVNEACAEFVGDQFIAP